MQVFYNPTITSGDASKSNWTAQNLINGAGFVIYGAQTGTAGTAFNKGYPDTLTRTSIGALPGNPAVSGQSGAYPDPAVIHSFPNVAGVGPGEDIWAE